MLYIKSIIQSSYSFIFIFIILTLTGCGIASSEYIVPKINLGLDHQTNLSFPHDQKIKTNYHWATLFNDPLLEDLMTNAFEKNLDLLISILRIEEARRNLDIIKSNRFPSMMISGNILQKQLPKNSFKENFYNLNIDFIWEIDLFGRIRRSLEASKAEYQVNEEDKNNIMISLYSTLFLNYIEIRTIQARLICLKKNITSQKESLELVSLRFKNGLATELDIAQIKRFLAQTEAEISLLEISLSQAINNLGILISYKSNLLHKKLIISHGIPIPLSQKILDIPKDSLRERPDVRKAEKLVVAQTSKLGIAKSKLYPMFFMNGSFSFKSENNSELFDSKSHVFSFGPSLQWNFNFGGIINDEIKVENTRVKQALLNYKRTVSNALNEIENLIIAYTGTQSSLAALERSVSAANQSLKLSEELYKQGLIDFQLLLDAQRLQLENQQKLAIIKGETASCFVKLYTALGGNWDLEKFNIISIVNEKDSTCN